MNTLIINECSVNFLMNRLIVFSGKGQRPVTVSEGKGQRKCPKYFI